MHPHPLERFRFCPCCGAEPFHIHDERSKRCHHCGFTYYHNASAATVAVIFDHQGRLLVTRRAFEPAKGTLDLPGGFVDPGESVTDGMLREIREEVGVDAEIKRFLFSLPNVYRFSDFNVHTCDCFFECKISDKNAIFAQDDAAEIYWLSLEKIRPEDFGLESIRKGICQLLTTFCREQD